MHDIIVVYVHVKQCDQLYCLFKLINTCVTVMVDIKPANMEELTEVITAAEFHPLQCNQFAYSSSKGCVRLCDMRSRALCDQHSKCKCLHRSYTKTSFVIVMVLLCVCFIVFEEPEDASMKSFFSEIISSMSDVKFSHNGRYMLTRDYLTARVWDLNMESRPVETYNVHEHLRGKLCALYENDCIFDKFECAWSGRDTYVKYIYVILMSRYFVSVDYFSS